VISAVKASSITQTGATISWTLNEVGTGQVFYGLTTAYGSTTVPELSFNFAAHAQGIAGLTAGTLYHFCVKSADQAGNLSTSGDYTFTAASTTTTNPPAPSITSVSISPTSLTLSPGAQSSLTATVAGTGTFSYGVTWSCLQGTITSGGLYTAPAAGSDTVTATSVQDGTKTATSRVTISSGSIPSGTSVKSAPYNAYGDGVHDDTAAIQACINAVAGTGGTVAVPDGTYLINPTTGSGVWGLMMGSNMTFAMTSGATLKAIAVSSSTYGILCSNGSGNFTITGGNIVGERATHTGSGGESGMGIYLNGANITVTGVNISECWGDGIYICDSSSNVTVTNCVCNHNRRQGLSISSCVTALIQNCTFSNTTGTDPQCGIDIEPNQGQSVTGVHITGCQIFNNVGGGIQQGDLWTGSSSTLIENNNIYGNGGGGYHDGGIRILYTHDNIIRNNNVHNNLDGGIKLTEGAPNTTCTGNTVTNNSGWGISADTCNGSVITGNTITGNSGTNYNHDGSTGTYTPNTTP
jgi:parallel beta-helix repeat protein